MKTLSGGITMNYIRNKEQGYIWTLFFAFAVQGETDDIMKQKRPDRFFVGAFLLQNDNNTDAPYGRHFLAHSGQV